MTPPKALVRKGRQSPRPKTPVTIRNRTTGSLELFPAEARAVLLALAAANSDEKATADIEQVIAQGKAVAQHVLENEPEADQWRRDQAQRLSGLIWELEQGRNVVSSSISADRYLRAAIEIGAILTDLDAYYWRPPHGPAKYDSSHFGRMDYHQTKGLKKKTAAKKVLGETFSKLPGDLENMANGLCQAYDRARRREK